MRFPSKPPDFLELFKKITTNPPDSKSLTPEQCELDREARLTINRELGHEREQVTAAYLGR